jgi:hypothetical protein
MQRLVTSGLLPERAGQPVKVLAHISMHDLMLLEGSSALQEQWIAETRAAWAAHRAAASAGGSDSGAWLEGDAAAAVACDASVTPVVLGEVNLDALDHLVRLCVELDRLGHRRPGPGDSSRDGGAAAAPEAESSLGREALEQAIIGRAIALVSGPGGLASYLRRQQLGPRLAGPSLAPGCRRQPGHSRRHPDRGQAPGPALPVGRRMLPLNTH